MYPIEELRSLESLSRDDLIDYIKRAYRLVYDCDTYLEELSPEWYSCAQIVADNSDYLRNCENLGLDK